MKKKRKYIYLEKCLIICILQIYIFSFYDFLFFISLSDAEFGEDGTEDFVGRDLAGDFAQVVHALANVLGEKVAREAGLQTVEGAQYGVVGVHEGFVVAGVGDDYVILAGLGQVDGVNQHRFEGVDVLVVRARVRRSYSWVSCCRVASSILSTLLKAMMRCLP